MHYHFVYLFRIYPVKNHFICQTSHTWACVYVAIITETNISSFWRKFCPCLYGKLYFFYNVQVSQWCRKCCPFDEIYGKFHRKDNISVSVSFIIVSTILWLPGMVQSVVHISVTNNTVFTQPGFWPSHNFDSIVLLCIACVSPLLAAYSRRSCCVCSPQARVPSRP